MKKKYAVIDDCTSKKANCFTTICESKEEALAKAEELFGSLTSYDKTRRDAFHVGLYEVEDGECYDCIEVIKEYI